MVGLLIVAALNGMNAVTDFIPAKWKPAVLAASVIGGTVLQVLAHFSNPDGTSANLPNGMAKLDPAQIDEIRRALIKGGALLFCLVFAGMGSIRAQGLPDRFGAAGMGFQSTAAPAASGWAAVCLKAAERVYTCGATDYAAGSSSARAEVDTVLAAAGPLTLFAKGGAGAATGAGGVGASYTGGGVATLDLSRWVKIAQGLHAVASITYTKNDVSVAGDGAGLQSFGAKPVFRFGFGRAF